MTDRMDPISSLRKIARELTEIEPDNVYQAMERMNAAAFLIKWIADGLERELEMGVARGIMYQMQDYYCPCSHGTGEHSLTCKQGIKKIE